MRNIKNKSNLTKDYATTVMILENLPDSIFILDYKGLIQYANQNALDLLQTSFKKLKDCLIDDIIQNSSNNNSLENQIRKGNIKNLDTELIYKGVVIPVFASFSVIENIDDNNNFIIVSIKNAVAQKTLEKELKHQQTITLSRDRIRALGELSIGMLHNISQPLTALEMKLELIKNNSVYNKDDFCEIDDLILKINNNINLIRQFAIQTEDESIGMVNISQSLRNAHKLIDYELLKNKINLSIKTSGKLPFILGNALLLEQVFVNLILNARDSLKLKNSKKAKQITIQTNIVDQKWIEIYFIDNGIGIIEGTEEKIFDPFFTTKNTNDNPGLGLSICHEIISSMGGDIFLNNTWEKDETCFIVRIPFEQENEREQLANLIELLHTE